MVSAISSPAAQGAAQLSGPASGPSPASKAGSAQLAPDTVSISTAGQKAASVDVDHDGDSH
jgi:hypothetical protein